MIRFQNYVFSYVCVGSRRFSNNFFKMSDITVQIAQGKLKGKQCITEHGFKYNSFQGIPYAKPPLGDLRFKDPEPADHWDGEYDASFERNVNSQIDVATKIYIGSEDSLHLNVYVPHATSNHKLLPVMMWIHGGGYCIGSGSTFLYGPDYLIEHDVVLVTINYRLGPLGFLCLHTDDVPGNAGMKDQVMALKWIKQNITKFGGDQENITIFGESAGGASVQYLLISKMAKGLFHKAISQSGSCLSRWPLLKNPEKIAFNLAEKLGFTSSNKEEVINFLRSVPVEELIIKTFAPLFANGLDLAYCPVVEKDRSGKESYISEIPHETLESGHFNKVPTMTGYTQKEGIFFYEEFCAIYGEENLTLHNLVPDFKYFLPEEAKEGSVGNIEKKADKIKDFYFSNDANLKDNFINLMSDFAFIRDIDHSVKLLSKYSSPAYYYMFNYVGSQNFIKFITPRKYNDVAHGDELGYLFKMNAFNDQIIRSEADVEMTNSMTEMWTNFAKYGNPTPKQSKFVPVIWNPVTEKSVNCLEISKNMQLITNPFSEQVAFWENLHM